MTFEATAIESWLAELGLKDIQLSNVRVVFLCEGKRFQCQYRDDYPDPRKSDWHSSVLSRLDQELINERSLVFRIDGELVFRLSGEEISCCGPLMANTRAIATFVRVLQLDAIEARRQVASLIRDCESFEEASEMIRQRPKLYADTRSKNLLPMLWGHMTRRRRTTQPTGDR